MDWVQFILFVASILGLFFWNRSESRVDMRHMDAKLEEHRRETNSILQAIQQEIKDFHREIKDFHGRLCAIEERRLTDKTK